MLAVFSSKLKAVLGALGISKLSTMSAERTDVHEKRDGKLRFPKMPPRMVRLRLASGTGIKGPAFIPSREFHHVSRQTCRAALRGLAFASISKSHPLFSRRTRRAVSRTVAKLEYIRMMKDDTNALPDEQYRAMTSAAGQ